MTVKCEAALREAHRAALSESTQGCTLRKHTGLHPVLLNYALSGLWERSPEGARHDKEGVQPFGRKVGMT